MRVLVADRDRNALSILPALLLQELDMTVVGQVSNQSELPAQSLALAPDIIVVDWEMISRNAADTLARLRGLAARPGVIVLDARPESRSAALRAGADAFVCKGDGADRLLEVLKGVAAERQSETPRERKP